MDIIIIALLAVILALLLRPQNAAGSAGGRLQFGKRRIILDSCALIDGRIVDLVRTGFVADQLVIPKFVLSELQMLADGNDAQKRERARFGLEVAAELREYAWVSVRIDATQFSRVTTTDDKLISLAKKTKGVLCTTDYNLNKVASVEGVRILNVNEVAQTLRPVTLPGEKVQVKILQRGSNPDQGVGYLDDGTMIVVDGGAKAIGKTVIAVTDRMHQTVAGKMVFAHAESIAPVKAATPAATPKRSAAKPSKTLRLQPNTKLPALKLRRRKIL